MGVKLVSASAGSVEIVAPTTASNFTLTAPAITATIATLTTPSFATTIGVGGATASASGSGISFPATQSDSSNANTLDDYEEGTWTPNQGAGLTVVGAFSSSGTYTKVGRLVYVRGVLTGATSISCSSSTALTSNLPFPPYGDNAGTAFNASLLNGIVVDFTASSVYTTSSMTATSNIFFSGTYAV